MSALDLNACIYEAEVHHRLEHVREYLQQFTRCPSTSAMVALLSLRALHEECLQMGHRDLSELCAWMERGVLALRLGNGRGAEKLLSILPNACDRIEERAHAEVYGIELPIETELESLLDADAA